MNSTSPTTPTIFNFQAHQVRTIQDEHDAPWFVAADVCEILEYADANDATKNLDDDEKLLQQIAGAGQRRQMLTISESGLYTLIIRSNKPQAKPFRKWVTGEVLPSIRRTGSYCLPLGDEEESQAPVTSGVVPITIGRLAEAAQGVKAAMIMARAFGYRDAQARRLANEIVRDLTGIDALELLGPSEEEARSLSLPLAANLPPAGRIDERTLAAFVSELCELGDGMLLSGAAAYRELCGWLRDTQGEHWPTPTTRQFHQLMARHFRHQPGRNGDRLYFGLGLINGEDIQCPEPLRDSIRAFIVECCREEKTGKASASELYRAFEAWCAGYSIPAPSLKAFGNCMGTMYGKIRPGGYYFYTGLVLADAEVNHG